MNSCEICGKERILETHHIKSRNKGGDKLWNSWEVKIE